MSRWTGWAAWLRRWGQWRREIIRMTVMCCLYQSRCRPACPLSRAHNCFHRLISRSLIPHCHCDKEAWHPDSHQTRGPVTKQNRQSLHLNKNTAQWLMRSRPFEVILHFVLTVVALSPLPYISLYLSFVIPMDTIICCTERYRAWHNTLGGWFNRDSFLLMIFRDTKKL